MDVEDLGFEAAVVAAEETRGVEFTAGCFPEAECGGFRIAHTVADDQREIVGMDMAGLSFHRQLADVCVVEMHGAEKIVRRAVAVVADGDSIGVPVFVADHLARIAALAQFPGLAGGDIEYPHPVIDRIPWALVAKGEKMRLRGAGVDVADPVFLLPYGFAGAAIDGDADDLAMRILRPHFAKADVAVEEIDRESIGNILENDGADGVAVGGDVDHVRHVAIGAGPELALAVCDQIDREELIAAPEVGLRPHGIHRGEKKSCFTRGAGHIGIGVPGDRAVLQIDAEEVGAAAAVAAEEEFAPVVPPAGICEIKVVTVGLVACELADFASGERVVVSGDFGFHFF